MPGLPSIEQVQQLVSALLITRKEAFTSGVPVTQLDQDYQQQEGTRIPFRGLGYSCLLDLLQSFSRSLCINHRNGLYYAFPLVTENSKHLSRLVAGQHSKPQSHSRRRTFRRSLCYPRVAPPSSRLDSATMAEVVRMAKERPAEGVRISRILDFARYQLDHNVDEYDLVRQLREISHEIVVEGDTIYPASRYQSRTSNGWTDSQERPPPITTGNDNSCNARPAGLSDTETDDRFDEEFAALPDAEETQKSRKPEQKDTPMSAESSMKDENERPRHLETEEFTRPEENESIAILINERTRFRLQKLIEQHPDGIWCADLPALYQRAYTIPLNYEELGFSSVMHYAAHLPEIFHHARPRDNGDFKLFDARAPRPNIKPSDIPRIPSLASLHNIYEQYVEPTEPIPSVLCQSTIDRLIPDGVMTIGETVAQICVTELDRGIHDYIDVLVVEVFTPSFFWIQLWKRIPKFNLFMNELHEFYESNAKKYVLPLAVMKKGMNCACMYDYKWHRGIIKKIRPDSYVTVLFYDYGTVQSYPPDSIHFLHRKFSNLPAQAIPCGLYNVRPVTGTRWSRSVACEFVDKATDVPLVATIAVIDTDNNSMLVGLTNTEESEDFHINDWMVQSGLAIYGKMGETVDMNDALCDNPTDPRFAGPTQQQRWAGQRTSSAIVAEEESQHLSSLSIIRNGAERSLELDDHMNVLVRLSMKRLRSDLEIHARHNCVVDSEVIEDFKELIKVLRTNQAWDNAIVENCPNCHARQFTTREITDPNVRITSSSAFVGDENANNPFLKCNETFERRESTRKPGGSPNENTSTNLFPKSPDTANTKFSQDEATSAFSLDSRKPPPLPPRRRFEDSLTESAEKFWSRVVAPLTLEECRESPIVRQLANTNPFRSCRFETAPTDPSGSSDRKFHETANLERTKFEPPRTPCHYQSGPVIYEKKNENVTTEWNEKNYETSRMVREREEQAESKRFNVESWIESGYNSPAVNGATTTCKVASNRGRVPNEAFYCSAQMQEGTSVEMLEAISNAIGFKRSGNSSQSSDRPPVNSCEPTVRDVGHPTWPVETARENRLEQESSVSNDATLRQTKRGVLGRRNWDIKETQITNCSVFLIIYNSEGWIALKEFAAAFTNKSPEAMVKILDIQRVSIPFLKIGRSDNSDLFKELDRSSVNIPRDFNNTTGDVLDLVPLKSALRILRKLNIIEREEMKRASKERIFPANSTVLYDIFTVITAWAEIEKSSQFAQ